MKRTAKTLGARGILRISTALAIIAASGGLHFVDACVLPVFRYAIERWTADPYETVVFFRDTIRGGDSTKLADLLESSSRTRVHGDLLGFKNNGRRRGTANMDVILVNVNDSLERWVAPIWEEYKGYELPMAVVRYPYESGVNAAVWTGPLKNIPVQPLVQSPIRTELSRRLLGGESGVWILLESDDRRKNRAAEKTLKAGIKKAEAEIELPEIPTEELPGWYDPESAPALAIKFSVLHLSQSDPAEHFFIDQLLKSEEGLSAHDGPIAFLVYGRGRALFSLKGEDLTVDNMVSASRFLSGPCSCTIKEQNPGVDLLMAIDWDAGITVEYVPEVDLPPLAGFSEMIDAQENATKSVAGGPKETVASVKNDDDDFGGRSGLPPSGSSSKTFGEEAESESLKEIQLDDQVETDLAAADQGQFNAGGNGNQSSALIIMQAASSEEEDTVEESNMVRNLILALAVLIVLVGVSSAFLVLRKKSA